MTILKPVHFTTSKHVKTSSTHALGTWIMCNMGNYVLATCTFLHNALTWATLCLFISCTKARSISSTGCCSRSSSIVGGHPTTSSADPSKASLSNCHHCRAVEDSWPCRALQRGGSHLNEVTYLKHKHTLTHSCVNCLACTLFLIDVYIPMNSFSTRIKMQTYTQTTSQHLLHATGDNNISVHTILLFSPLHSALPLL